jgi:hypothetical protein
MADTATLFVLPYGVNKDVYIYILRPHYLHQLLSLLLSIICVKNTTRQQKIENTR